MTADTLRALLEAARAERDEAEAECARLREALEAARRGRDGERAGEPPRVTYVGNLRELAGQVGSPPPGAADRLPWLAGRK